MAYSTIKKTVRDLKITLADLAASHSLELTFDGELEVTIPGDEVFETLDRGRRSTTAPAIRYGDEQPMTFKFNGVLRDLSDASYITMESIIGNAGYFASTWVSTLGATAEVKTITITIDIEGTDHGDSADHQMVLKFCRGSGTITEGKPCMWSYSGTSFDTYPDMT